MKRLVWVSRLLVTELIMIYIVSLFIIDHGVRYLRTDAGRPTEWELFSTRQNQLENVMSCTPLDEGRDEQTHLITLHGFRN